jgi:hypothetical protein
MGKTDDKKAQKHQHFEHGHHSFLVGWSDDLPVV